MSYNRFIHSSKKWYLVYILYAIYFTQGIIFPSGILSQVILVLILAIGAYSCWKCVSSHSLITPLKIIVLLLGLITITFIVSPGEVQYYTGDRASTFQQFKGICGFFLPLFIGYNIGRKQMLSTKELFYSLGICMLIALLLFAKTFAERSLLRGTEEITNNRAYTFLYALPFALLLLKKYKIWSVAAISIVVIFVFAGAKRGAIISLAMMGMYYLWWSFKYNKMTFKTFAILFICCVAAIVYVQYVFSTNNYLEQRLNSTLEGSSSGRDVIYAVLFDNWFNYSDFFQQIFGHGTAQSVTIAGKFAHNDWLELLIDNGLLGVTLYALFFISFFNYIKRVNPSPNIRLCLITSMILWLLKTVFSMGFTSLEGGLNTMLIGLLLGNTYLKQKTNFVSVQKYDYK